MASNRVFRKTEKGMTEVASAIHLLDRLARRILILIDGKKTVDDLSPMLTPGEAVLVFVQLHADGFIEPIHADTPPRLAARLGVAATTNLSFIETKALVTHEVETRLGEFAETVNAELEPCQNVSELSQKLREIDRFVMSVLGDVEGTIFASCIGQVFSRTLL